MSRSYMMKCGRCLGTGREFDHALFGAHMRRLRLARNISLRAMARYLRVSAPYLCNLEYGTRSWTRELAANFRAATRISRDEFQAQLATDFNESI